MILRNTLMAGAAVLALAAAAPEAGAQVKIGMVTTLSTPGGYLGEDVRDAFLLAMEEEGGKLGGVAVTLMVEDDGLKPPQGLQIADKFLKRDEAKILTGIIFSNVAGAVVPKVLEAGAFYVSPNAGPSNFAGKGCHKNYFVASWQNDTLHESAGQYATNLGYKRMVILAPNYQAGKDALTGFKRFFKGEVIEEIYTKLDQTDFAPEMARIRAARPDAVFQFHPGGLGINFLKQYVQAGLKDSVPMVVAAPSMDVRIMAAVGDAALGVKNTSHYNIDFDNAANRKFVEGFRRKYNREPTDYASQGYDTAKLIGSALKAVGGDLKKEDAFRAALQKANFESTRGKFNFGRNHHPVQDWYAREVTKGPDGKLFMKTVGKVMENRGDAYASECGL